MLCGRRRNSKLQQQELQWRRQWLPSTNGGRLQHTCTTLRPRCPRLIWRWCSRQATEAARQQQEMKNQLPVQPIPFVGSWRYLKPKNGTFCGRFSERYVLSRFVVEACIGEGFALTAFSLYVTGQLCVLVIALPLDTSSDGANSHPVNR